MTRIKSKLIALLVVIAMLLVFMLPSLSVFICAEGSVQDSDVSNSAIFSTDTI